MTTRGLSCCALALAMTWIAACEDRAITRDAGAGTGGMGGNGRGDAGGMDASSGVGGSAGTWDAADMHDSGSEDTDATSPGWNDSGDKPKCLGDGECHASTTCVNEAESYACQCVTVEFSKPAFADPALFQDCIQPDVCLTRGNTRSLYNAAVESETDAGPGSAAPAGTRWKLGSCVGAIPADFNDFLSPSFANAGPANIVGRSGCLFLPNHDAYYSVVFLNWGGGVPGGGFAYRRTQIMPKGTACP